MPHNFDPVVAIAWDAAVARLMAGNYVLDGVYPMAVTAGVVLLAVADHETLEALESAPWKSRLLILLREELDWEAPVLDVIGVIEGEQQERSSKEAAPDAQRSPVPRNEAQAGAWS